jgi:hypothetical protein
MLYIQIDIQHETILTLNYTTALVAVVLNLSLEVQQ